MTSYAKVFQSITRSSVWVGQPSDFKVVWVTLLVLADEHGLVRSSILGIAKEAEVTVAVARAAIELFSAPDPNSTTKDCEGRRIAEHPDGGWQIVNHQLYQRMRTAEDKRAKDAIRQANWRSRQRMSRVTSQPVTDVTNVTPSSQLISTHHTKASSDARVATSVPGDSVGDAIRAMEDAIGDDRRIERDESRDIEAYDYVTGKRTIRG